MFHPKRLAFALIGLALLMTPVAARSSDAGNGSRFVVHFLVRHPHGHVPARGAQYRPAEPLIGLWQPPAREDAIPRAGDRNRSDLHAETVPLLEIEW